MMGCARVRSQAALEGGLTGSRRHLAAGLSPKGRDEADSLPVGLASWDLGP